MKKHIYIYEKVITIVLSFVMIAGLLGGMKLDARAEEQVIDTVEIKVEDPVPGQSFPGVNNVSVITPAGEIEVTEVEWWKNSKQVLQGTVEYNTKYMVAVKLKAKGNYKFSNNPKIIINDSSEHISWYHFEDHKGIRATHDFQATAPDPAKTINSININIDLPAVGQPFPSVAPDIPNATGTIRCSLLGGVELNSNVVEYDTKYLMEIQYNATDGYVFADKGDVTINSKQTYFLALSTTKNKSCSFTYTFQTAKAGQAQTISNIEITVPKPVGGQKMPSLSEVTQRVTGAKANKILWCEGDNTKGKPYVTGNAKYNTVYTMVITYEAEDGFIFGDNTTATVNGNPIKFLISGFSKDKKGEVTYTFPATDPETTHTINSVEITIDPPEAGKTLAAACNVLTEGVFVKKVKWQEGFEDVTGQVAHEGTVYQLRVYLEPKDNYDFGSFVQTIVNGTTGSFYYDTMCVSHEFTATAPQPSDEGVEITAGNNSTYEPGSNEALTFHGSGELDYFQCVKVDGGEVDPNNYDKSKGSTIIKFKPEYLATLSNGSHTIEMVWNVNGAEKSAKGSFYIGKKSGEVVPGNTGTTQPANNTESKPRHTCSFEWVITLDPTTGADGLEEYKCTGCGVVQESHPIPASVAVVKDFYGKVKEAPEKGSITYDSGKLYTISDYILKKMAERNDVAVTVKFEYQNKKYQIIFPAGLDYSAVLNDEETMYGYFGAAAKLGLKVTEQ